MAIKHTYQSIGGELVTKTLNRKAAIKEFCASCLQSRTEVKHCTAKTCALYPFRLGEDGRAKVSRAGQVPGWLKGKQSELDAIEAEIEGEDN